MLFEESKITNCFLHKPNYFIVFYKKQFIHRFPCRQDDSNYTHFHLVDGHKATASKMLKEYEDLPIDQDFASIHKGYLVNSEHVGSISSDGKLMIRGKGELGVAKGRFKEVRDRLLGRVQHSPRGA